METNFLHQDTLSGFDAGSPELFEGSEIERGAEAPSSLLPAGSRVDVTFLREETVPLHGRIIMLSENILRLVLERDAPARSLLRISTGSVAAQGRVRLCSSEADGRYVVAVEIQDVWPERPLVGIPAGSR